MNPLSEIMKIMAKSPMHKNSVLATLLRTTVPAVDQGLYVVDPDRWFCTYGYFNKEQIEQFMARKDIVLPWTYRPGTVAWVINFAATADVPRDELRYLAKDGWKEYTDRPQVFFARNAVGGGFKRVGFMGRSIAA